MNVPQEVVWEGNGVRVLEDGSFVTRFSGLGAAERAAYILARALVEAKRENERLQTVMQDMGNLDDARLEQALAAREAAESMRDNAEMLAYGAASMAPNASQRDALLSLGHAIRAIPLPGDDK